MNQTNNGVKVVSMAFFGEEIQNKSLRRIQTKNLKNTV